MKTSNSSSPMQIEVWSDILCPFCYIGKRKLELALEELGLSDSAQVEWKSFQLNPDLVGDATKSIHQYLAEVKGWSIEQSREMNQRVSDIASSVGLTFKLDSSKLANSLDAHRLLHLARVEGKQDAVSQALFMAYFSESKDIADRSTLKAIGLSAGIAAQQLDALFSSAMYKEAVLADQQEAAELGVRGVPYFVFNRQYAVSGAQEVAVFKQVLEKVQQQ